MSTATPYAILPDLSPEEYEALKADIARRGVQVPIELDDEGNVLDGHHRLRACAELDISDFPRVIRTGLTDEEKQEHALRANLTRRHLTKEQREELVQRVRREWGWSPYKIEEVAGIPRTTVQRDLSGSPDGLGERSVGRDGKSYPAKRSAVLVTSAAEEAHTLDILPETPVPEGWTDGRGVKAASRKAKREEAVAELDAAVPVPEGPFDVIVIDPPWQYEKRAADYTQRGKTPYPPMSLDEMEALFFPAADDCVLWLWTTNAFMADAHYLADQWGFDVKTILTWAKHKMGFGDWLRGKTEHCLMCVRGKPTVTLTNQTTLLHGDVREHSRKPDEFYALVESLCPGRKLEMFARERRDGWIVHGNEPDKFQTEA